MGLINKTTGKGRLLEKTASTSDWVNLDTEVPKRLVTIQSGAGILPKVTKVGG